MIRLSKPNISECAISQVVDVLQSGNLVQGKNVRLFEEAIANYIGTAESVVVSSCTAALHLALVALDIGVGDAILLPNFTFPATGNVVRIVGALPVLVEVKLGTYNIDVVALENAIVNYSGKEKLKALIVVHEFGVPCDMTSICAICKQHNILLIEDAACALGSKIAEKMIGSFGIVSCFSFHPRKILTTGEGGAIVTNQPELARRIRRLRSHGIEYQDNNMCFLESSTNYRMTDFQAVLGIEQLQHLDSWIAQRNNLAQLYYRDLLLLKEQFELSLPDFVEGQNWQTYMLVLPKSIHRADVISGLKKLGVESNLGAQCLSEIGLFGETVHGTKGNVAKRLFTHGLTLPMYEGLTKEDVAYVCQSLGQVLDELRSID